MRFRLTLLAAVLAASALVPASAGARAYTAYRFRVAKVELKATTVLDGTDEGLRTTEHLTRTATVNYRGKRGDNAEYIAVPRVAFAGTIHVGHLLPVTTTESGSWTRESS